jgi:putative salt-induced outer membrane protein YdiY
MRFLLSLFLAVLALPIVAQTPPEPAPPPSLWTGSVGAGLALTSGNTDTKSLNASVAVKYDPHTRFVFKADALYLRGDAHGETQVDKATANARGEQTLSDRTFAFGEVSYLRDPFKGIDYLVAPLVGGGYRIIKSDRENLSVDGAVGAQFESGSSSGAVKAGENFDLALSATSKVTQKLTGLWKTSDFGDALYHFDAGLSAAITARSELKLAYAYDYKTKPSLLGAEKGDSALFAAFLFKF